MIDLISKLQNVTPQEAVKLLNTDYNLGLDLDKPIPTKEIRQRQRDEALYQGFKEWERRAWLIVSDYLLQLRADIKKYKPDSPDDLVNERFTKALHEIDFIDYLSGIFINGDFTERLAIYKTCRREITRIEKGGRNRTA